MFVACVVGLLVVFIIFRLFRRYEGYDLNNVPGPPGYPIIGNLFDILADRVVIFSSFRKWNKTYNGFYKLVLLSWFYSLELSRPEDIEIIISSSKHNKKAFFYYFLSPWLNDGLILSSGSKWHERRKLLTPAFHFNILRNFTKTLSENSHKFANKLVSEVDHSKCDIWPLLSDFTLTSICETAMGTKIDNTNFGLGQQYKTAVDNIGTLLLERVTKFWLFNPYIFNMSSYGKKQKEVLKILKEFPTKIINERRLYREKNSDGFYLAGDSEDNDVYNNKSKRRVAMLDLLITAEKENNIDHIGIQEEVDNIMFAGHDTTGAALMFAMLCLANDKNIQDKVFEELQEILGNEDKIPTIEDLNKLKFLECCIKETLRLYPIIPVIGRELEETVTLHNCVIPAGVMCNIHIFDLHRNEKLYPNPLVYDPDRFLPENCINRNPYTYIPFSAGPRNCIGQKYAILQLKAVLAAVLLRLEILPVTKHSDVVISGDMVLRPVDPIFVSFALRK